MAPIVDIDVSAWPTSGTATAGSTGFYSIGSGWTHGVDADGRKYIEKHNSVGGNSIIEVADPADLFNATGDRARLQAGIMLTKLATLDYATPGITAERFIDTLAGERSLVLLRHGTDYYSGEAWRFEVSESGPTATETDHPWTSGLLFDQVFEMCFDHAYDAPGWVRCFIDGFQVSTVNAADMTGVTADRVNRWSFPDVPSDRVRYRLYGDRDDRIRVWDDDFSIRPRTDLTRVGINLPMDIEVETAYTGRNFWRAVSGDANITPTRLSGGVSPGRIEYRVAGGAAELENIDDIEIAGNPKKMIVLHGVMIDTGGSITFNFKQLAGSRPLEAETDLFGIRLTGGNVQVHNGTLSDWLTVGSYSEGVYYNIRINRSVSPIRVSLENISADFESAATLSAVGSRACPAFTTGLVHRLTIIADECRFNMVQFLDVDWAGIVSSYTATPADSLTPDYSTPNRSWGAFPKPEELSVLPGFLERTHDLTKPWATTTMGRTGNEITDFSTYNIANLGILGDYAGGIMALEYSVNDLSPVRLSEEDTLATVELIVAAMFNLIDKCCAENIYLWVGKQIGYPTGGSTNWPAHSIAALDDINTRVRAYMEFKDRPDILVWCELPGDVDTYFATDGAGGSTGDDIHFDASTQHAADLLASGKPVVGTGVPWWRAGLLSS